MLQTKTPHDCVKKTHKPQIQATTLESSLKMRLKRLQKHQNKPSWICNTQNYYRSWGNTHGFQHLRFPFSISNDWCRLCAEVLPVVYQRSGPSLLLPLLHSGPPHLAPLPSGSASFRDIDCSSCAFPALSQRSWLFADLITSWAHRLVPERIYLPTSLVQVSSKENLSERVRRIVTPSFSSPKSTHLA